MGELFFRGTGSGGESIESAVVTLASSSFTYDGTQKEQAVSSVVLDGVTLVEGRDYVVVGNRATNAGTHTLNVLGVNEYTGAATTNWTISKAQGSISLNPTTLSLFGLNTTGTSTITKTGDGNVSVSSSDSSVATASVSGNTVTVTAVAAGSATITVTMADGDNYLGASCTLSAEVVTVSPTLSDNTPAQIQQAAQAGIGASLWSVGDKTAEITFQNVTVGALSFNGLKACAFIIGFDHNSSLEGTGIHFQFGKTTGGADIAWIDNAYPYGSTPSFQMNTSNTNVGGWNSSYMRSTICPAFLTALPSAWQNVIATTTKYTDNTGNKSTAAANVTATSDKIFLLNQVEVFNSTSSINSNEANKTVQYAYYANGNSKIKYKHDATSTACSWWLRSPNTSYNTSFGRVDTDGNVKYMAADYSYGFAPGFKVA